MADIRILSLSRTETTFPDTGDFMMIGDKDVGDNDYKITIANAVAAIEDATKALARVLTNKSIDADNNTITNIANDEIKAAAAIALNKLAAVTASKALVSDASGFVSASATTAAQIALLAGLTAQGSELNTLDEDNDDAIGVIGNTYFWFKVDGTSQIRLYDGSIRPETDNDIDIGTLTLNFKDGFFQRLRTKSNATLTNLNFAADTGTIENTFVVTLDPAPAALAKGMILTFIPDAANTGACTINVNGLGAAPVKIDNAGALADPAAGDLDVDIMHLLIYDGTNWQLKDPS